MQSKKQDSHKILCDMQRTVLQNCLAICRSTKDSRIPLEASAHNNAPSVRNEESVYRSLNNKITDQNNPFNLALTAHFEVYTQELRPCELTADQYKDACKEFSTIPSITAILNEMQQDALSVLKDESSDISSSSSSLSFFPTPDRFDADMLVNKSIKAWVDEFYSPVDERILASNARAIRRMNSLARLLAVTTKKSVCTAVTIDLSQEAAQLVIAANVNKNDPELIGEIFAEIILKLDIIKKHLTPYIDRCDDSPENISTRLAEELLLKCSQSIPSRLLRQSALKIARSVCQDDGTFTKKEKMAFLKQVPSMILLPGVTKNQGHEIHALMTPGPEEKPSVIMHPLPQLPKHTRINNLHAEQLIAYFLYNIRRISPMQETIMGITKLCCQECRDYLKNYPVKYAGTHSQSYKGTINLHTLRSSVQSPKRHAETAPFNSLENSPFTPEKRPEQIRVASPSKIKRLFPEGEPSMVLLLEPIMPTEAVLNWFSEQILEKAVESTASAYCPAP
jgi:hypothetical protein